MNNVDRNMDLTPVQRDILTALINIHRKEGRAVKGEEIAELKRQLEARQDGPIIVENR